MRRQVAGGVLHGAANGVSRGWHDNLFFWLRRLRKPPTTRPLPESYFHFNCAGTTSA